MLETLKQLLVAVQDSVLAIVMIGFGAHRVVGVIVGVQILLRFALNMLSLTGE